MRYESKCFRKDLQAINTGNHGCASILHCREIETRSAMEQYMSLKILIVAQEPKYYASIKKYLAQFDFIVEISSSVKETKELLKSEAYGLLMIDLDLKEMNGFELAALIKDNDVSSELPIIFITDKQESKDNVIAGLQTGGVDFVLKPFDIIVVMLKVRNYLMYSYAMKMLVKNNQELTRLNMLLEENINYHLT